MLCTLVEVAVTSGDKTYSTAIESAENYTRWIVGRFRPFIGRRVLEVGLGHGAYRRSLPSVDHYVGLDIDASAVEDVRQRYPTDCFMVGDITDPELTGTLEEQLIDTVLCLNVLEHIEDDRLAIERMISIV